MKPPGDRMRSSDSALHRRCGAGLVILVAAVSLGTQPALSGDAVQAVQPSAIAGRVRPLDLVKSSVSQVLAAGCSTSTRWLG